MQNLIAMKRQRKSTHDARTQRRSGKVIGNIYGKGMENLLFEIGELELDKEISENGEHGILTILCDGQSHKTLIKELQRDPVSRKMIHIDLEEISDEKRIHTEVPIVFTGEENLVRNGLIIQKEKSSIKVKCTGAQIPKSIPIDLSNLKIGDTYRIADIEFSKEITLLEDNNAVIVAVLNQNINIKDSEDVKNVSEG